MAKFKIEDYGIWYDDETDLIFDDDGKLRCTIPDGTFHFEGKLYTYGTVVKKVNRRSCLKQVYTATFQRDTEEKRVGGGAYTISMKEAQEYYDGKPFELDEIFLEVNGTKKEYLDVYDLENGIIEIVQPVYYEKPPKLISEPNTPPTDVGFKTEIGTDSFNPTQKIYKDHLYNCNIDYQGNIIDWFEPFTFGYEKYIYTVGTKVILKERKFNKSNYYVAVFDGSSFIVRGYPHINYRGNDGKSAAISPNFLKRHVAKKEFSICRIIEPHYYKPVAKQTTAWERFKLSGEHNKPIDTAFGTILYIVIMIVGTLFKARWLVYIVATLIFVLWRYGHWKNK